MIKLTELCGVKGDCTNPIWIPADVVVRDNGTGVAQLKIPNLPGWISVAESPEEVTRKILEYKLAMISYTNADKASVERGDSEWVADNQIQALRRLAGLEAPHDPT